MKQQPQKPQPSAASLNLPAMHTQNLAELSAFLAKNRFCYLMPNGKTKPEEAVFLFDAHTGLRYSPQNSGLETFLAQHPFVYVRQAGSQTHLATLHSATGLLWNNETSDDLYLLNNGQTIAAAGRWAGLQGWQVPSTTQFNTFATAANNPHRKGGNYQLAIKNGNEHWAWLTTSGQYSFQERYISYSWTWCWRSDINSSGRLFAFNPHWVNRSESERFLDLMRLNWELVAPNGQTFVFVANNKQWQGLQPEQLLINLKNQGLQLRGVQNEKALFDTPKYWVTNQLGRLDFTPCRLPELETLQICDPEKGLWELFGVPAETLQRFGAVARDPIRDKQLRAVAIDFGTSSTVVAMDTANGGRELLRIGVRDFYQAVQPADFENPTVLECLDFNAFNSVWTQQAYRPALNWNWMRAAHEAQTSLRDNTGETQVLASIMPSLKRWALRSNEHRRTRITDRKGLEVELAPHIERNPVRGQALQVNAQYLFDPIELYAWFLGMAINWRGRGIFLKYYLSFPVKYSREVKDRILASFRRGLQRSLPPTLITHHPETLNDFEVNDLASEPAAYAAAALKHLNVQATDEGVPYAVFDFGGGTSDFDYGLLRWATDAEYEQGNYDEVFEHLASSGDNFLGGENLLENLVYSTFRNNLEMLRTNRIQFTQPIDANPFAGSESFLASTQAAQTNTIMLAAKLRTFLEADTPNLADKFKLTLLNSSGEKVENCELALDKDALDDQLQARIRGGLQAFLAQLAQLRSQLPAGAPIQMLLAGNGCRSRHIKALTQGEEWKKLLTQAFGDNPPEIVVREPLPMDANNPHAPTAKTGVALGLLRLTPGKNTLLLNHVEKKHDGQAPFAWFVGRLRRGQFEPKLSPGATYGQWHEVGALQQGVFNLYTSASPRAHHGMAEGDAELRMLRQDFHAAPTGARLFARAINPHEIELTTATDLHSLDENTAVTLTLE